MSHYSWEGRRIEGTCNFVAEKGEEKDSGWIENNGDSELENAKYVAKLIYYYFVAVCNGT
jgi:hypothetical protein